MSRSADTASPTGLVILTMANIQIVIFNLLLVILKLILLFADNRSSFKGVDVGSSEFGRAWLHSTYHIRKAFHGFYVSFVP